MRIKVRRPPVISERVRRALKRGALGADKAGPIWALNDAGEPVCGANETDGPCQCKIRIAPSGRCRVHGGAPGSGRPVSVGIYSSSLPKHLLQDYEKILTNPDMLSMRDCIATIDALIMQYQRGLLKHPPVEVLQKVIDWFFENLALVLQDVATGLVEPEEAQRLIMLQVDLLKHIKSTRHEEREVRQAMRERADMVKAEAMRVEKSAKYLTIEEMLATVCMLADAVNKYVSNDQERLQLSQTIDRTLSRGAEGQDRSTDILPAEWQDLSDPSET
jgi:hypothetical protein